ncbi:MAG TPA: S8 family serine peptidase, partial [Thermoanaerobaculia bacterium]|nr:S8 family serine peptidase [Thermoanaerobaculia bacterium]
MATTKDRTGKKPAARKPAAEKPPAKTPPDKDFADDVGDKFGRVVIPPQLEDPEARESWGMPTDPNFPCSYIVELNILHASGLDGAAQGFVELYASVIEADEKTEKKKGTLRGQEARTPRRLGKTYFAALVSLPDLKKLVIQDGIRAAEMAKEKKETQDSFHKRYRTIYRVWPDFKVKGLIDASVATIKADAAFRAFAAAGAGVVWAVIDSGVQGDHPHFAESEETVGSGGTLGGSVEELHRCFCEVLEVGSPESGNRVRLPDPDRVGGHHALPSLSPLERRDLIRRHRLHALQDEYGHGTHVGGIIAGGLGKKMKPKDVVRLERRASMGLSGAIESRRVVSVRVPKPWVLRGVAPACRLVSLRVLDHNGEGLTSDVIRALEYIRESLNDDPKLLRVHGVNLSVGYEFDAEMFA